MSEVEYLRNQPNWQYTDSEIRRIYCQSKDKKNQVKILAELNCCSVEEIKKIIGIQEDCVMKDKNSTDDKKNFTDDKKNKINWDEVFLELDNGENIEEVAMKYGTSIGMINRVRAIRKAPKGKKNCDLSDTTKDMDIDLSDSQDFDEYARMRAVSGLIQAYDSTEVKTGMKRLIIALAEQAADRAIGAPVL